MGAPASESPRLAVAIPCHDAVPRSERFLVETLASWGRGAGRLLEYAAGNGRFCGALAARGFDVVAVEPDASLREWIRGRGVPVGRSLEALGDERFGGAYAIHPLEQLQDDAGLLAELRLRLVPRGRLFLYLPAFPLLFSATDARVGSVRRYRRQGLRAALQAAGFRVTRATHVDSIGFALGLWARHFGDPQGYGDLDPATLRLHDRAFPLSRALDVVTGGAIGRNLLLEAVSERD